MLKLKILKFLRVFPFQMIWWRPHVRHKILAGEHFGGLSCPLELSCHEGDCKIHKIIISSHHGHQKGGTQPPPPTPPPFWTQLTPILGPPIPLLMVKDSVITILGKVRMGGHTPDDPFLRKNGSADIYVHIWIYAYAYHQFKSFCDVFLSHIYIGQVKPRRIFYTKIHLVLASMGHQDGPRKGPQMAPRGLEMVPRWPKCRHAKMTSLHIKNCDPHMACKMD